MVRGSMMFVTAVPPCTEGGSTTCLSAAGVCYTADEPRTIRNSMTRCQLPGCGRLAGGQVNRRSLHESESDMPLSDRRNFCLLTAGSCKHCRLRCLGLHICEWGQCHRMQ